MACSLQIKLIDINPLIHYYEFVPCRVSVEKTLNPIMNQESQPVKSNNDTYMQTDRQTDKQTQSGRLADKQTRRQTRNNRPKKLYFDLK